jgi:Pex19 protein family
MLEKMAFGTESGFGGDGASGDLGGLGGLGGLGDILPAMQGMLQSLLSKDLLYPSIKEIVNKVSAFIYVENKLFVLISHVNISILIGWRTIVRSWSPVSTRNIIGSSPSCSKSVRNSKRNRKAMMNRPKISDLKRS